MMCGYRCAYCGGQIDLRAASRSVEKRRKPPPGGRDPGIVDRWVEWDCELFCQNCGRTFRSGTISDDGHSGLCCWVVGERSEEHVWLCDACREPGIGDAMYKVTEPKATRDGWDDDHIVAFIHPGCDSREY